MRVDGRAGWWAGKQADRQAGGRETSPPSVGRGNSYHPLTSRSSIRPIASSQLGQTPSPGHKGAGVHFTRGSAFPCLSHETVSRRERRDIAVLKAETPRLGTLPGRGRAILRGLCLASS